MSFMDKAKDLAGQHRDKIEDLAGQQIDQRVQGDNAQRAKDGLRTGLDRVLGNEGEATEGAEAPAEQAPEQG